MSDVNQSKGEATSPTVAQNKVESGYVDPFDLIFEGLNGTPGNSDQPTLKTEVEENAEDQEDSSIEDDDFILEDEEAVQNEADDENEDDDSEEVDPDATEADSEDEDTIDSEEEVETDEDESEEDEEDEEEDAWFFTGDHSEYRTSEDAKKGIIAKDAYIVELETISEELKNDLATAQHALSNYTSMISEEVMEAAAIQSLLPAEYRGKTDDDFEDDVELRKFWKAELKAKEEFENKQRVNAAEAKAKEEARMKASKDAAKFVRDTATNSFFGIRNPEERNELKKVLTKKDDSGYTPIDRARMITEVFGPQDGLKYLEGLRLSIQSEEDQGTSTTKSKDTNPKKKVVTHKAPPKKVVQKVKKAKVKKKVSITPPPKNKPKDKYVGADALTMISDGLK